MRTIFRNLQNKYVNNLNLLPGTYRSFFLLQNLIDFLILISKTFFEQTQGRMQDNSSVITTQLTSLTLSLISLFSLESRHLFFSFFSISERWCCCCSAVRCSRRGLLFREGLFTEEEIRPDLPLSALLFSLTDWVEPKRREERRVGSCCCCCWLFWVGVITLAPDWPEIIMMSTQTQHCL